MSGGGFLVEVDDAAIKRERVKARALRASPWWKRRCAPGICHYCGAQVGAKSLTMDHLVPIIRGGRSTKGNVVPACRACNAAKRHQLPFELEG
ncbi:MAG: HNH endonuclease [Candidatus Binatia bacterium]